MDFLVPQKLETERLILRQFQENDWRDLHEYYMDGKATKYTESHAFSEGETWRTMCILIGHWQMRGYGPYAVEEKASGKVLGPIGFWFPNDWPSPEIMWALAQQYWGKGFASEAVRAVQSAGRKYLPDISLISFINAGNLASIRLAIAVGAEFEKEVLFRGDTWHIYRHPNGT